MELVRRPQPLGEQIVTAMQRAILTGEFSPDVPVTEESLAERFSVSRGPIREALKLLEQQHLVRKAGRSYRVTGPTHDDVDEIYALRLALEQVAWDFALSNLEGGAEAALDGPLQRLKEAAASKDVHDFAVADIDFHSAVVRFTGKRRLIAMWDQLEPSIRMILGVTNAVDPDLKSALAHHVMLAEALTAGDGERVRTQLAEHLNTSRRSIR